MSKRSLKRLTVEMQDVYVEARRRGMSTEAATRAAGTSEATVCLWLRRGRAEPDGPYGRFRRLEMEIRSRSARSLRERLAARRQLSVRGG
jgi:hypothetical protein